MASKGRKLARLIVQDSGDVDVSALDNAVVGAGDITSDKLADNLAFPGDAITLPSGDSDSRPTPAPGMMRYNTDTGLTEQYNSAGWQGIDAAPAITGISPTTSFTANEIITIAGSGFKPGAVVKFVGQDNTEYTSPSVTIQNSATIQAETPAVALPVNNEPYTVKVTNQSGLSSQLDNALDAGSTPTWNTASGNIGTAIQGNSFTGSISATDPDGQSLTYTLTSGALPTGLSLNSSTGSITGTESGSDSYASGGITKSFNIETSDGVNTSTRSFNIIKKWADGTSSDTAASSAEYIQTLTGTTTNGLYWINLPTVGATQVFCNMSTYGGGWMLAMRLDSTLGTGTVRHYFDPNWWTDATSGLVAAPSNAYTNGEGKYAPYSYFPHTEFMLEYGYGSSYWASTARARYEFTGSFPAHNNTTMLYKQGNAGLNYSGNYTINGYRTDQTRWTRQQASDTTFFPTTNAHLNYASSATSNSDSGNDFFRIYYNNQGDRDTIDDSGDCNQVGGWGMVGDIQPSSQTNIATQSYAYDAGNSSATIAPPYGSIGTSCQWNDQRTAAGNSGKNYNGNTSVRVSSNYYNNGIGLIWLR